MGLLLSVSGTFKMCWRKHISRFDRVVLDVDMLGAGVVFRIVCKCDGALVVAVDDVLIADVVADFFEEAEEPDLLLERMKECHVFRFSRGERN